MASSTTPIADSDRLGYRAYSDALWQRIELALNKDAKGGPLGDDPLVVGIFGEWGAGKSQLLKILFERAQQQTAREIAARSAQFDPAVPFTVTVPVFFQPWKYEHEAHLHVPIAVHIADALDDAWKAMPTDFEKVKHYAAALTDKAESAVALVEKAEGVFKKITGLLSGTKKALSSDAAKLVAGVGDTMLATAFVPPFLSAGRLAAEKALKLTDDESVGNEDKASGSTAADKAIAKATTEKTSADKIDAAKAKAAQQRLAAFQHSDNGLGFYRVHKLLADLTRPKLRKDALVKAGMKIAKEIEFDLRINFVVFIDDLDRCLPEKAVQTLEIIKTVFNAESFAFVLALDEEVIERGIGHRYKEYELVGKKPQMPISGFEYLEKIVHLPFRLPALTLAQAHAFVRGYEASIEPDAAKRWFDEPSPLSAASSSPSSPEGKAVAKPDLLNLALSAFDAYVPRKLIRLVELVHQVSRVQATVGGGSWLHSQIASGKLDQRVVLVMLMLQLFQPELYRLMRRKVGVLPGLMAAFSSSSVIGKMDELQELDTADLSDSD